MRCLVCKNLSLVKFMKRQDGLSFFKCGECELLQTEQPKKVSYESAYFDKKATDSLGYADYSKIPIFELFWQIALIKLLGGQKHNRILEIGCATGRFMELALKEDFEISGIEISKFASKICLRKGLKVKTADAEGIKNFDANYDFICAWDLIEHLKDPLSFFKKVIAALSPKGTFIFSTPNATDKNSDWFGFKISQEHLVYFSKKTIEKMVAQLHSDLYFEHFSFKHDGLDTLIGVISKNPTIFTEKRDVISALKNHKFVNNERESFLLASIYANFNQKTTVKKNLSHYKNKNSLIELSIDFKSPNFYRKLIKLEKLSKSWSHDSYYWSYLFYLQELQSKGLKEEKDNLTEKLTAEREKLTEAKESFERELYKRERSLEAIYHSKTWAILGYYRKLANFYKRFINLYILNRKLILKDNRISFFQKLSYLVSSAKPVYFGSSSNRLYDIIIFSVISWEHKKQRPQHLARQFAKNGHRVFYIENSFVKAKLRNLSKRQISSLIEFTNVERNIFKVKLVTYNDIFIYRDTVADLIDLNYLLWSIKEVLAKAEIENFIMKVDAPFWYQLSKRLKAGVIYDCIDEHSGFWTHSKNISIFERELSKSCQLILTTSSVLYRKMREFNENVVLVSNACDFKHFSNKPSYIPKELKNLRRPIIGYFGAISNWLDYKLIGYIARKKPGCSVVVIGNYDSRANIHILTKIKNIHYLGEKKYENLPSWVHNFDVCILPFKIMPLTLATNPVKMYEILATGKPLVSVDLPEVRKVKNLLYIAKTKAQFIQKINLALKEKDTRLNQQRIQYAAKNTWNNRYQLIEQSIKRYIYPKVSVIILSFNTLKYTKSCIESVAKFSNWPNLELIVVDNNSTDSTREYLQKAQKLYPKLKVILNKKNVGFAGGNNIGILEATGEYIILLNNDTIVTSNWIEKLIKHLQDKKLGLVGPVTNNIGNEAKIDLDYKTIEQMHEKAKIYTENHQGQSFETKNLAFFCVAGRKKLFEEIGPLDEQFKIGFFEDDDYCLRVKKKGYKLICAEDVFIHHEGQVSVSKIPDLNKIFNKNRELFEKKWNLKWIPHKYRTI